MQLNVLYFAHARRLCGLDTESYPWPVAATEQQLWSLILQRHPDLKSLCSSCRIARNHAFVSPGTLLQPGDEVAIIPPVSGG